MFAACCPKGIQYLASLLSPIWGPRQTQSPHQVEWAHEAFQEVSVARLVSAAAPSGPQFVGVVEVFSINSCAASLQTAFLASLIERSIGLPTLPHITTTGKSLRELTFLVDFYVQRGIHSVLALGGRSR